MRWNLRHISIFLYLVINFCYILFRQNELLLSNNIPFKILKESDQHLDFNAVLNSESDFKSPDTFTEKTHPDNIYWIKLNLNEIKSNLNIYTSYYLKFNSFDFGNLFYQKNGTIVNKAIERFDKKNL